MTQPVFIVDPRVQWESFSNNVSAVSVLEQNLDKVEWYYLSCNPEAIHLLKLQKHTTPGIQ